MNNANRMRGQLPPARTPNSPMTALDRAGDVGAAVVRQGPRIGAQVFSVFDARPIGARDFIVTVDAAVNGDESGLLGFDGVLSVPPGTVAVLRRILVEFFPALDVIPGVLTVGIKRSGTPLPEYQIRHGRAANTWSEVYAVFGPDDTMGVWGLVEGALFGANFCYVTFAGTLLPSNGLPPPLEVGHGTPRVRIVQADERGIDR